MPFVMATACAGETSPSSAALVTWAWVVMSRAWNTCAAASLASRCSLTARKDVKGVPVARMDACALLASSVSTWASDSSRSDSLRARCINRSRAGASNAARSA